MQWSSTREDLFPESLCRILGRLHDQAPTHSYQQTRRAILKHFKRPIEAIFDDFPLKPCASGSIAQVRYPLTASSGIFFQDVFYAATRIAYLGPFLITIQSATIFLYVCE